MSEVKMSRRSSLAVLAALAAAPAAMLAPRERTVVINWNSPVVMDGYYSSNEEFCAAVDDAIKGMRR